MCFKTKDLELLSKLWFRLSEKERKVSVQTVGLPYINDQRIKLLVVKIKNEYQNNINGRH